MFILSQIVGFIAIICWVISVQLSKKSKIILFQTIANILYSVQYFLLNAIVAAFMNLVSFVRLSVFYTYETKNKRVPFGIMLLFMLIIIVIGIFTVNTPLMLIPILATLFYTYSSWQDNMQKLRIIYIVVAIFWIYYNFTVGAYISLIGNTLEIISGISSLIKYKTKKGN